MSSKKVELKNGHIMVREVIRTEEETKTSIGIIIPQEVLDDEQVSQGEIIESSVEEYKIGENVIFHKVIPVDINMKYGGDKELRTYWFVKEKDIICKIINT